MGHSNSKFSKLLSTSSINSNSNSNNSSNSNSNSNSIINSNKSNKSNSSNNNNNNNNKTNHRYYRGGHSRCLLRTVIKEGEGKVRCFPPLSPSIALLQEGNVSSRQVAIMVVDL